MPKLLHLYDVIVLGVLRYVIVLRYIISLIDVDLVKKDH